MGLLCEQLGEGGSHSIEIASKSIMGTGPNSQTPLHEDMLFECGVNAKRQSNFVPIILFEPQIQSAHLEILCHRSIYCLELLFILR